MSFGRILACAATLFLASAHSVSGQEPSPPENPNAPITPLNPLDPNAPGKTNSMSASAPPVPMEDWEKRQNADERLTAFGTDLLGDGIDPHTGSLSFQHTDVSIPGNNRLPVAISRRRSQGMLYHKSVDAEFGDWELEVPRIKVTSANAWTGNRCSSHFSTSFPDVWLGQNTLIRRREYSNGLVVDVPGAGSQQMMKGANGDQWLSSAQWVTTNNWYFTCGSASDGGQGFLGYAPNGDVFRFDRYITHRATDQRTDNTAMTLTRRVEILAATEVTDKNGNWVRYTYDSQARLTRVHSNDGRDISLQYQVSGRPKLISRVSTNGRNWNYSYSQSTWRPAHWQDPINNIIPQYALRSVTLPDGRQWSLNLDKMNAQPKPAEDCYIQDFDVSVTHPSGVAGTFNIKDTAHRYDYQVQVRHWPDCIIDGEPAPPGGGVPPPLSDDVVTRVMSVHSKTLTGSGAPTATWTYDYEEDYGPAGTSGSDRTNWTKVSGPGVHITYVHSWTGEELGGVLKRQEIRASAGGPILETRTYDYTLEADLGSRFSAGSHYNSRPQRMVTSTIARNDTTYTETRQYNSDFSSQAYSYGAPTTVTASSTLGSGTRTTTTTYEHNTSKWILGLPLVQTTNGKPLVQLTYDANGNITEYRRVGTRKATLTYNAQGLLSTYSDGINRLTQINSYHRGVPTSLTRPDGVTVNRTVDNNGWVTSQTDGNNVTTFYGHNAMGWLTVINRPSPWSDTAIAYSGLGAGLVQTSTRGNARSITTYDRYHRPTTVQQVDLSGVASSTYTTFQYDGLGRTVFASLPSFAPTGAPGIATTYDGLGRVLTETMTADASVTSYSYGPNNSVSVIDPEGNTTTTHSSGFASPDDGNPVTIAQPEGMTTTMTYDIWGNLTSATQGGFTQSWAYDNELRLCRHRVPERQGDLFDYNDADELILKEEGASATSCGSITPSNAVSYTYDALGRPTFIDYPAGTSDIAMTYDNNGNMLTNTRGGASWSYAYNAMDLVTSEVLSIDGKLFTIAHYWGPDERLHKRHVTGLSIDYAPDGFGRPTEASWTYPGTTQYFASGANYTADGQLEAFTYGNGKTYDASFNARQLMTGQTVSGAGGTVLDFDYARDANGRITDIFDTVVSGQNRAFTYDGLGRLTQAYGPWGNGTFAYDGVNNLTQKTLGSRTVDLQYNSNNRLNRMRDSAAGGVWKTYGYDARGNTTWEARGGHSFVYDRANQPISMSGASTGTFTYDGHMRRVKQVINGETVYSIYSLSGEMLYRDNVTTNSRTHYVRMGGMTVARVANTWWFTYLHPDHLGSPAAATDTSGNLQWREDFTPFGEARQAPWQNGDQAGYTGHIHDADTGLTYMQARYYDPIVGRFLSNDPVGFAEGGVGYFNRYSYVANDPINAIDPDGNFALTLGGEVRGSFAGYGFSFSGKLAVSLSRSDSGGLKVQGGLVGSRGASVTGPAANAEVGDPGIVDKIVSGVQRALTDTGVSAGVEAGAFVGTDDNPADVEDLAGPATQTGGSITVKGRGVSGEYVQSPAGDITGLEAGLDVGIATTPLDVTAEVQESIVTCIGNEGC